MLAAYEAAAGYEPAPQNGLTGENRTLVAGVTVLRLSHSATANINWWRDSESNGDDLGFGQTP
jgi:hypothetical protein